MNTQQIFYLTAIFALVIIIAIGFLLIYYIGKYQIPGKKQALKLLDPKELAKMFNIITGKKKREDEDFDNGYITGVQEFLQFYCNDYPDFYESGIEIANDLIKNYGHFERLVAGGQIIFVEKDSKEQENEARD